MSRAAISASMLCLCALLTVCAHPPEWGLAVEAWTGRHTDQLVGAWGPPDSAYTYRDGRRVLVYAATVVREETSLIHDPFYPGWYPIFPRWVVTGATIVDCKAEFRADAKGFIVQAGYGGDMDACDKLFLRRIPTR